MTKQTKETERDVQVHFMMSKDEYEHVLKKMEQINVRNLSAYLRKMAIDGYCLRLDLPEIREMTTLLSRCSNNLNQYARKANATGSIYKDDIADLKERLSEIEEHVKKVLQELLALK